GAVLKATNKPDAFPLIPSPWEGPDKKMMRSILEGSNLHNVTITGKGVIDGNGAAWWALVDAWKQAKPRPKDGPQRPKMLNIVSSDHIRIAGVTFKDSPSWNLHPLFCNDVTVDGVTVQAPENSHNTDGIDPESSTNVTITHCT